MELYSNYVDSQNIEKNVGADYANAAVLASSGMIKNEGAPGMSTQVETIQTKVWADNPEGQAVGVGGQINLRNRTQTTTAIAIVNRADGMLLDSVADKILNRARLGQITASEVTEALEANITLGVSAQGAQMLDSVVARILDGLNRKLEADNSSGAPFVDTGSTQISLALISQLLSEKGEAGRRLNGGFVVLCGLVYHKLQALGVVAATSNTFGNAAQDEIVKTGIIPTILGMNVLVSDRIDVAVAGNARGAEDEFVSFVEREAFSLLYSDLMVYPIVKQPDGRMQEELSFWLRAGGTVAGMGWSGSKTNIVQNSDLATATNWEKLAVNYKNVSMATLRIPTPSF